MLQNKLVLAEPNRTEPNALFTQTTAKQVPLTDVLLNFHTGLHKSQTPAHPSDLFLYGGVQNFNTNKLHCFTVHFHSLSLLVPKNALF
jgi:hypothetical protein